MSFGPVVKELLVCCHKINMNTKENDIIKRVLNLNSRQLSVVSCDLLVMILVVVTVMTGALCTHELI